ncbi:MAG: divalent metal cation transporter, partial [Proteobacteria bacterium]|nr:divalent metal cation transporter [Pseudomonadota bacterium]
MFAAAAVGTSHLVQSTRAGGEYGLSMMLVIIGICALKYPVFRFAAEYAALTGKSVLDGYARQGRGTLWIVLGAVITESLAAVAGVTLVTAGIANHLLALPVTDIQMSLGLLL